MARLDDMRVVAQLAESGSISAAAKALGISLKTLYNKIHRYQIET